MSAARSMPQSSRYLRNALGERHNSTICSKFGRFFFISSSAWGLNMSTGEMWMWQSVIMARRSLPGGALVLTSIARGRHHRVFGEDPNHLPPVLRRERRRGKRLGGTRRGVSGGFRQSIVDGLADEH